MNEVHYFLTYASDMKSGAFSIIKHKQSWPILKMLQTPRIRSSAVKINNSQRIVHE
nr:MAG TPA: hypothetical protein [Bacteriophage sp.]DAT20547.1 MAG TPA: hypothetical protein [Caudoviricetes sp.]